MLARVFSCAIIGLDGAVVEVEIDTGATLATTSTDANGIYSFSGLTAGNYQVRFINPDPAVFEYSPANFGFIPPGSSPIDAIDSDPLPDTGLTLETPLADNKTNLLKDAGFFRKKGDGCTPGISKTHLDAWSGLNPTDDFETTFGVDLFDPDISLEQTVNAKGCGENKMARHGTAALLGALHPDVEYPLTEDEVIAAVKAGDAATLV